MISDQQKKDSQNKLNWDQKHNNIIDPNSDQSQQIKDDHMKVSGVKASFERGFQSQKILAESFQIRHQQNQDDSIDECETFNNTKKKQSQDNEDSNYQIDQQIKKQFKSSFSQQPLSFETETIEVNNHSTFVGRRIKKIESLCANSIGGDIDQVIEGEGNLYSQQNESIKINRRDFMLGNELNEPSDDPNTSKQYNINEDKNLITRNVQNSRRGSRKIHLSTNVSGMNVKENNVTTNNVDKYAFERQNLVSGIKGGFFFAMKMKKYANHLVSRLQSRRYAGLRARHLQFFNDKTITQNENLVSSQNVNIGEDQDEFEIETQVNIKKKIIYFLKNIYSRLFPQKLKQMIHRLPLFSPSNSAKLLWDFLNMISIIYFLIFFPLRISFGLDIHKSPASYIALGIIFFDILVFLNTGFYNKGTYETDRIGILINYIDSRFFSDLISMIPFIFYNISDADQNIFQDKYKFIESIISLLFLVRVSHLGQIKKKIEEKFYQNKTLTHNISLLTLLTTALYIAHMFSCFWIIVAEYKMSTQDTWMHFAQVQNNDCLYFLIITMTTVGYGDIKPQNNIEHLLIIIIVLISSGVFSFSINQIEKVKKQVNRNKFDYKFKNENLTNSTFINYNLGTIVQQMQEEKAKLKETVQVINNYMNKKNINMNLQQQIREYLEYYLKESSMNDNETEDKIIDMLSEPLKRQLMIEANKIALKDSPIFRNNFSEATISKTVSLIQELRCTPEELLFYEGDINNCAIFFVQKGKVELFIDSVKSTGETVITSLKEFSKGSCFGETSFFTGTSRGMSIRSIDFTTLLMIKRSDFLNVVQESSEDYENFCKIKDKIIFYKNFDDLGIKCISCNNRNHFLNDCPYIHYVPDKEKIIKIHQRPIYAERMQYDQPRLKKFNVFDNLDTIVMDQMLYSEQNMSFLERQDWFDRNVEDDEEQELYNYYEDHDQEGDDEAYKQEDEVIDNINKSDDKQYENQHELYHNQTSLINPSAIKEDSYVQQHTAERLSIKRDDVQYLTGNIKIDQGETHSHKSGYKQFNNLEVDERRDKSISNLGVNDISITPSGLILNLINPNPGNIKENSYYQMNKRKRSSPTNKNNTPKNLNKTNTLQNDDQQLINPIQVCNYNTFNSALLGTPQLTYQLQPNKIYISSNTNISNHSNNNNNPKDHMNINNYYSKQSSSGMPNPLIRRSTKHKNTEKTMRSTHKRRSTKRTIDSKMNIQAPTNSVNEKINKRQLTIIRKGIQENQFQNTLLALQGMENILLQNKSNTNSSEFDIMKCYEIYFPHNNIDIVIFQLRKKNPQIYSKSKSFIKSHTKKFYGALTMNSQHKHMSKMNMVLQKLQNQEQDDDKESLHSNKYKSLTKIQSEHLKQAKMNEHSHQKSRNLERKRSFIIEPSDNEDSNNLVIIKKAKSMKFASPEKINSQLSQDEHHQPKGEIKIQNQQEQNIDFKLAPKQSQSLHQDEIYLEAFEKKQTIINLQAFQQNSITSSKLFSSNLFLGEEEISPTKKNVSFQENKIE